MGFMIQRVTPRFNDYEGAGVLAGTSTMYRLRSTGPLTPIVVDSYDGDLYTADRTRAGRIYTCAGCGRLYDVGPGQRWLTVMDLKSAGCESCDSDRFRPGRRIRAPVVPANLLS